MRVEQSKSIIPNTLSSRHGSQAGVGVEVGGAALQVPHFLVIIFSPFHPSLLFKVHVSNQQSESYAVSQAGGRMALPTCIGTQRSGGGAGAH